MSQLKKRSQSSRGAKSSKSKGDDTKKVPGSRKATGIFAVAAGALFFSVLHIRNQGNAVPLKYQIGGGDRIATSSLVYDVDEGVLVTAQFDMVTSKSTTITLGPHKATLSLPSECPSPGLWLRVEGDALVVVSMNEHESQWEGSFTLPIEGNYSLVAYWYGCDGSGNLVKHKVLTSLIAKDIAMVDTPSTTNSLFPSSAWISSKKFQQASEMEQPYVWHNPQVPAANAEMFKTSETFVAKDSATLPHTGFYEFKSLSNYELVCWVGGASAELLQRSFLNLRTHVSSHQRPFKFHFYNSTSFMTPDAGWTDPTKEKFRKCKHILVSMDPVKPALTQAEYLRHVQNFIGHLLKAFPDDTFPIWMFTVLESPTKPTNCLEPHLPRTSDHPCNTALKDLFRNSPFPEPVRFLDNTDVTLPHLLDDCPKDVATAIALRIFVFVGKQVEAWRAKGQVGGINGLQRGDHLEPNFKLVPYMDWGK